MEEDSVPRLPRPFLTVVRYAPERGSAVVARHPIDRSEKWSREAARTRAVVHGPGLWAAARMGATVRTAGDASEGEGGGVGRGEDHGVKRTSKLRRGWWGETREGWVSHRLELVQ